MGIALGFPALPYAASWCRRSLGLSLLVVLVPAALCLACLRLALRPAAVCGVGDAAALAAPLLSQAGNATLPPDAGGLKLLGVFGMGAL